MARKKPHTAAPATEFVVLRDNWRRADAGWRRGEGRFRLSAFDARERAEADAGRREERARLRVNPFECGPLAEITSYPEMVLADWVQDAGLTPPTAGADGGEWAAWWERASPRMGPDQRLKLWEALDRLRFYHVEERPAVAVGYVVLCAYFHETDTRFRNRCLYLEDEGGEVLAVHRTCEGAERWARATKQRLGGDRGRWFPSGIDPFDGEALWRYFLLGCPLWDIVEVEMGEVAGEAVHLVVRRTLAEGHASTEHVPVRAFADRAEAEALCRELEADFRRRHDVYETFEWYVDDELVSAAVGMGLPPRGEGQDIGQWWRAHRAALTADQRAALWDAVPDSFVHEVIEAPLRD